MNVEIIRHIINKAEKISLYLNTPRTDKKYQQRKETLEKLYAEAEHNYQLTADEKYKEDMKRLSNYMSYNVSYTEYKLCKKDMDMYRRQYCENRYKAFWEYIDEIISYDSAGIRSCVDARRRNEEIRDQSGGKDDYFFEKLLLKKMK